MAQSNALNPSFAGNVKALSFSTPPGTSGTFGGNVSMKVVGTSTSTPIDVFGSTIGFAGTLLAVRVWSSSDTNATVDITGVGGTICRIIKGSIGAITGCYITSGGVSGTALAITGTLKASVNSASIANNCLVEAVFVPRFTEHH